MLLRASVPIAYAVVYTLSVRLGYAFRLDDGSNASVFWPAAGISLAALLLRPTRQWPLYIGIALAGSGIVKSHVEGADLVTVLSSIGFDVTESVVAAAILRARTDFDTRLDRVRDLLLLAFVSFFIATPVAAGLGALRLVHEHPHLDFFSVFQTWSLGDSLGILLFTPAVLATARPSRETTPAPRLADRSSFLIAIALVVAIGLGGLAYVNPGLAAYLAAPILCYAAFRHGLRVTSYLAVLLSTSAVIAAHASTGVAIAPVNRLTSLQMYGFASVAMVLLAAAFDEQRRHALEHVRVERSLRTAQKFEALGRLSSGIAHDFNNVLTAIVTTADLITISRDLPRIHRMAEDILSAATRGGDIVRQLMDYGRREVGSPSPCALAELLRRETPMLERILRTKSAIDLRIDDEELVSVVDATALSRVLMNLVTNAKDASTGSPKLTVTLSAIEVPNEFPDEPRPRTATPALPPGRYACIAVADRGAGMTEDVLHRMFDPFFTTKAEGEGTGLGLASAFGIVDASGGAIVGASAPGEGTTMRVLLPVHDP